MASTKHKFGIITSGVTVAGISIESFEEKDSIEKADVRGTDGKIIERRAYSRAQSITITGVIQEVAEGGFTIQAGQKLTIGNVDYLVDDTTKPQNVTSFAQVTINASTADGALITPYTPPAE